ncbi:MAG: hypothetical protein WC408_05175, partial [Candidatus Micrarchaeia archaeon]
LKQLLKSAGIYGAEAKIGGFSGYVCELLVLNYRSLHGLLQASSSWKLPTVIDIEGSYFQDDRKAAARFPGAQLVVVDVTDANRNAAAAISQDALASFILLSRAALENPRLELFFQKPKVLSKPGLVFALKKRGTHFVCIKAAAPKLVDDIFYPQLYKTRESLSAFVSRRGFQLVDRAHFADEKHAYLLLEFAYAFAPTVEVCPGPPAYDAKSVALFVKSRSKPLRGPFVKDGRVYVEALRSQSATGIVKEYLSGNNRLGTASHFQKPLKKAQVLVGPQQISFAASEAALAELSAYALRKAHWL